MRCDRIVWSAGKCLPANSGRMFLLTTAFVISFAQAKAFAQPVYVERDGISVEQYNLTLSPAALPTPALKYELIPRLIDRRPGNAVVWYGKVKAEQNHFFNSDVMRGEMSEWGEWPLEDLRDNETVRTYVNNQTVFTFLERGARSESCDWQIPIRDEVFYSILLPDIQETRTFARLLAGRVRYQIANGEFEEAVRTLQVGIGLGRNVADAPTLINSLVGVAIYQIMGNQMLTMSEQPGAPNLYWALTALPNPAIDFRRGVEAERDALFLSIPELNELESTTYSDVHWNRVLVELYQTLVYLTEGTSMEVESLDEETIITKAMEEADAARNALTDDGFAQSWLAGRPDAQVVLLRSVRNYEKSADDVYKWLYLPYPHAMDGLQEALDKIAQDESWLSMSSLFVPAGNAIKAAQTRMEQKIAMLRIVEAIRAHSAENDGELPKSLDDITIVPVPNDPVTGVEFKYSVEGDAATLAGGLFPNYAQELIIRIAEEE